jgi:Family of unknown function (DUF5677)
VTEERNSILDEVSNQIKALLDAGDTDKTCLAATKRIHEIAKAVADQVCRNVDVSASAALVIRCIARKTDEALAALIELVERGHAYAAATMLRQMCEELIFAKFILSLPREEADEFIRLRTSLECYEGIEAQEDFFTAQQRVYGVADSSDPRLIVRLPDSARRIGDALRSKLKALGKRVGWGSKPKPTVKQMAERSGMTDVYGFFYHASSSSVHASLHHLLRMVWFDRATNAASITNRNFQQYYQRFALIYGSWIASKVIDVVTQEFPGSLPQELDQPFNIWLALTVIPAVAQRAPPIVTREEIRR